MTPSYAIILFLFIYLLFFVWFDLLIWNQFFIIIIIGAVRNVLQRIVF